MGLGKQQFGFATSASLPTPPRQRRIQFCRLVCRLPVHPPGGCSNPRWAIRLSQFREPSGDSDSRVLLGDLARAWPPMTMQNSARLTSAGGIHTLFWKDTLSLLRQGCSRELRVVFGPGLSCFL